jgi:hypothetical protein
MTGVLLFHLRQGLSEVLVVLIIFLRGMVLAIDAVVFFVSTWWFLPSYFIVETTDVCSKYIWWWFLFLVQWDVKSWLSRTVFTSILIRYMISLGITSLNMAG